MKNRLLTLLGLAALCVGFAVSPAEAAETRTANFLFVCDGTNKDVSFVFGGLGASVNRFIQGAEIILFENRGGLQYILFGAGTNKHLVGLGSADQSRASHYTSSLIVVQTNASGNVTFSLAGACNPGAGQIQGTVTVFFFS